MKLRVNYVYMGHYLVRLFLNQSVIGVLKKNSNHYWIRQIMVHKITKIPVIYRKTPLRKAEQVIFSSSLI